MSFLAKCLLWALCTTFVLAGAKAQEISQGTGVLCDTKQQIERFISLEANSVALQAINADEQKTVCAVVEVQYVRGVSLGKLRNTKGTFEAATPEARMRPSLITGALTPGRVEASFEPTGVVCRILVDVDRPPSEKEDESVSAS
jgi:hypothetical protein